MPDQVKYNKLQGKQILIIGGSSGIGYAVAEASLEASATVTISSSNPSRVDKAVSTLKSAYPSAKDRVSGHACNLGDESSLDSNIETLLKETTKNGKLDHIVYTAGDSLASMKLDTIDMAKVKQAGMVRFFGPLFVGKHASKYLNAGPASSYTITTGAVSEKPIPDWSVVGSYATGLQGMTRQLALDLKPVRVNLVSPGAVATELWQGIPEERRQGLYKSFADKMTTGVVGKAEDVAESYVYLMKDYNVSGSMVSTNGGHLLL
ncbi:hypothetical protein B0A48_08686 [Cryoendolithus antarcticus]|uniref:NAD(P)-binding protein n=1 Tax=Cryoendolithus antarcticus TaxID=1507870 RepID=A0A1V8T4F5_9PEZI|nr:hypothetical protein B0A48_08686 [Cryoendolithus antarcticus]